MTAAASMNLTINGLMGAQRGILSIYQTNKQTKNMKKKESLKKKKQTPKPSKKRGKQQSITEEPPPKAISAKMETSLARCRA